MDYALITGASGGIGLELAGIMASKGHPLILVARRAELLQTLKQQLEADHGIPVEVISADLSLPGQARAIHSHCRERGYTVSYLVNNAGYGDYGKLQAAKLDTYTNLLQLNILALTEMTTLFAEDMKQRGFGRILNVGSLAAFQPCPNFAVYAASKSYVMNFTEALNYELRGSGVTATALNPGVTETGFVARAGMQGAANAKRGLMSAATVAAIGYDAMMRGKLNVVPGWKNLLLSLGSRTMPSRELLVRISAAVMRDTAR
ncbi:MAG: SDR family oxidoreductase [Methylobacterium sp.]|nr:SDR family oxidoreductase [Methylobacterium sp.]